MFLEAKVANVGIVIVSHSPKVAEGAADMVRQMVGNSVRVAHAGGNPEGGLGTDVAAIVAVLEQRGPPFAVSLFFGGHGLTAWAPA